MKNAISQIKDGSCLIFSGFELSRAPIALVDDIIKQQISDLTIISFPNPLPLDMLIKAKLVKKAIFGFNGFQYENGFIMPRNWRNAIENNEIEWYETDVYEIITRLKGKNDVDFIRNSDYTRYNKYKEKNGKLFAESLKADFAIIHTQKADKDGNVLIDDPLNDNILINASKKVIVSFEELVDEIENPTIPKSRISSLIKIPKGAMPTACFSYYDYSLDGINHYFRINNKRSLNKKSINENSLINNNFLKYKIIDQIIIALSKKIEDGMTVTTGVASFIPMVAILLAKKTHAPNLTYLNCSGAINPDPKELPYDSASINFLYNKEEFLHLADIWDYKIDLMFFSGVQIDKQGNVNNTVIGDYKKPKVKLPGPAGMISLRSKVKNAILFTLKHNKRTFVEKVDFITSRAEKDTIAITNLGILKLGKTPEILGVFEHSSVREIKENTGFELIDNSEEIMISDEEIKKINLVDKRQIRYNLF